MIKYFSHKHKLHLLLTLEYKRACLTFRHLMLNEILLSFRFQMYLLNSVACLYRSFLNEHTWFLYLNLNAVSQTPMYVLFEVGVVTSAWYIMFWSLHSFIYLFIYLFIYYILYATEEERMKALRESRNKYQKNMKNGAVISVVMVNIKQHVKKNHLKTLEH